MPNKLTEKLDAWYDRQSLDTLVWIGLSPMILICVVAVIISLICKC